MILIIGTARLFFACNGSAADVDVPTLSDETSHTIESIHFIEEMVHIYIHENGRRMTVEGEYTFKNSSSIHIARRIYFPFKIDDSHPRPLQVTVSTGKATPIKDGVIFPLEMKPNERKAVRVSYSQQTDDNSATYIVTSALAWGETLKNAEFRLTLPSCLLLQESSMPLEKVKADGKMHQWLYRKTDFFPSTDFTVRWR